MEAETVSSAAASNALRDERPAPHQTEQKFTQNNLSQNAHAAATSVRSCLNQHDLVSDYTQLSFLLIFLSNVSRP
jgi:hypothetical protein